MDDAMGVAVLQGVDDLNEDLAGLLLVKLALVLHVVHELAALGQLHDHYQLLAFDEGVVKLDNILVAQLLDTVRLLIDRVNVFRAMKRLRHIHELDGILHVCLPVSREMNSAEASLSNFFVHLVVVQNRAVIK